MTKPRRDTIHDLLWRAITALYDGDPVAMQTAIEEANAEAICAVDEMQPIPAGCECFMEAGKR